MKEDPKSDTRIAAALREYERLTSTYEKLVKEVKYTLDENLAHAEIKVAGVSKRVKTPESFKEKLERKQYENPLRDITDLAGVRVVCYYENDLQKVGAIIRSQFEVHEEVDKSGDLGVDKMGYHGAHFVISLGPRCSGPRYDAIIALKCEIQVRTVLQDAWALISHHLVYKNEASIPTPMKRDLNNVASLLEIAQGVFDSVRDKRQMYLDGIRHKDPGGSDFLSQPIDYDTLVAYTEWKFKNLPVSRHWHSRCLGDLNLRKYRILKDIDDVVEHARPAVEAYRNENPDWFKFGTDFLTKSLGFVDEEFRQKHSWGGRTREAFQRFQHLLGPGGDHT